MSKFLKSIFLIFLVFIIIILSGILVTFQKISNAIGKPSDYLLNTLTAINKKNPYSNKGKINFILLGFDKRDDLLEKTNTTDTIMFVSLNLKNHNINTISIPRDLWFYEINSKVNEIYPLSLSKPDQLNYIKNQFSKLLNQPIDHVVILTTENLISFVNLINGVDVVLENGFIDTQFPNPEYINNPNSNISKYKTVEFKSGLVHLDKTNITEFVRSRKGAETSIGGGTDIGRIQRQQLLVEAILNKVKTGEFLNTNPNLIDLYYFWDRQLIKDISDLNIIDMFTVMGENIANLTINKINIPIGTNSKDGIIYHPSYFNQKQWVFIPNDKEYQSLHRFISESI